MALTDFDEYVEKLKENRVADFQLSTSIARTLRLNASWQSFNPAPAVPTTSVALNKDSAQSMGPIPDISTGRLTFLGGRFNTSTFGAGGMLLVDLLNVSGGLNATSTTIGAGFYREVGLLIPIPLQAGDTGVESIESVTVTATTGTAGNFGVCMFKPLAMISLESATGAMPLDSVSTGCIIGSLAEIDPDACLAISVFSAVSTSLTGAIILTEA
jgi:hypothetical protein